MMATLWILQKAPRLLEKWGQKNGVRSLILTYHFSFILICQIKRSDHCSICLWHRRRGAAAGKTIGWGDPQSSRGNKRRSGNSAGGVYGQARCWQRNHSKGNRRPLQLWLESNGGKNQAHVSIRCYLPGVGARIHHRLSWRKWLRVDGKNAISLGGDADTMACIAGGIAQAFYKRIPAGIVLAVREKLTADLLAVVDQFNQKFNCEC